MIKLQGRSIIQKILDWKPALATTTDEAQNTPLHYAASIGNSYAVRKMLSKNPDAVYKPNSSGSFPVHLAAEAGSFRVINEIQKKCPDVGELLDQKQRNFLHIAVEKGRLGLVTLAFMKGILNANMINARDKNGNTPLHLAVKSSDSETVTLLFWDNRVNPNIRNEAGLTPLDISTSLQDSQFTYSLVRIVMVLCENILSELAENSTWNKLVAFALHLREYLTMHLKVKKKGRNKLQVKLIQILNSSKGQIKLVNYLMVKLSLGIINFVLLYKPNFWVSNF